MSVVNIEENSTREPVNYVLPPGVSRITDPGQTQITQLNEQSLSLKLTGLNAGDARGIYRNTQHDLRNYKRLQMWTHAEALIDNTTNLRSGDFSIFIRLGSDVKTTSMSTKCLSNSLLRANTTGIWPAISILCGRATTISISTCSVLSTLRKSETVQSASRRAE